MKKVLKRAVTVVTALTLVFGTFAMFGNIPQASAASSVKSKVYSSSLSCTSYQGGRTIEFNGSYKAYLVVPKKGKVYAYSTGKIKAASTGVKSTSDKRYIYKIASYTDNSYKTAKYSGVNAAIAAIKGHYYKDSKWYKYKQIEYNYKHSKDWNIKQLNKKAWVYARVI